MNPLKYCKTVLTRFIPGLPRTDCHLNPEKSEAILLGTGARLRREDQIPSVSFAETTVGTRTSVKSLGVTIDSGLTFNEHVDNICKASAYHIRSLRHIRKFIDEDAATSVATALVSARIDYCNSLLYGTSKSNIDKLQRLQNSLVRVVLWCALGNLVASPQFWPLYTGSLSVLV